MQTDVNTTLSREVRERPRACGVARRTGWPLRMMLSTLVPGGALGMVVYLIATRRSGRTS